jgi:hypothetical protein
MCAMILIAGASWACAGGSLAQVPASKPDSLNCMSGPVEQTYSRSKWMIYSCDDGVSLVVVASSGPAMPFVFFVTVKDGDVVIHGEGTGDKAETDITYEALKSLKPTQVADLIAKTKAVAH